MITNTDITIYHREYDPEEGGDIWNREYVPRAWWYESQKSSVTTEGLNVADVITVRIPDTEVVLLKDDYIVKGCCEAEMQTVKDLSGMEYMKVTAANRNLFGGNPHVKAVGV